MYTLNAIANVDNRIPGLANFPNSFILDMSDATRWSFCPGPIKIEISHSNLDGLMSAFMNPNIMRYGGSYEKRDEVHNGAPVYRKKGVIGNRMYLYTYDNGTWHLSPGIDDAPTFRSVDIAPCPSMIRQWQLYIAVQESCLRFDNISVTCESTIHD